MGKLLPVLLVLTLLAAGCSSASTSADSVDDAATDDTAIDDTSVDDTAVDEESAEAGNDGSNLPFEVPLGTEIDFGPAPVVPDGELSAEQAAAVDLITASDVDELTFNDEQLDAVAFLGESEDPRFAWILLDVLRFSRDIGQANALRAAASDLLGANALSSDWDDLTDRLMAWDVAAPPDYVDAKRSIYSSVLAEWRPFFDPEGDVDWRFVSWGGVRIDDQPFDNTPGTTCNCIPAVDNPETQPASEAAWLEEDDVVFGVVINGEARAYPRQIMEVREMVNDTLGGRDFAMPYCTLCGAAQVWFTDNVVDTDGNDVERPILRTSGLLTRSNKVMYELNTSSVFDTFLGTALTGPLREAGVQLEQHTVVTTTWGAWVEENPDSDVLIEELALGRDFDFRNGRDAAGPIFPIGDVDPRLDVQEDVLGLLQDDGTPIAFHVNSVLAALRAGETVEVDGITIVMSGSGIKAVDADGIDVVGHQAFWFAWSQFYENTELWTFDDLES